MAAFSKEQGNLIYRTIGNTKLNPEECSLTSVSDRATEIKHGPSGSVLRVNRNPRPIFEAWYTVGGRSDFFPTWSFTFGSFIRRVQKWADRVARYHEVPDFWKTPPGHGTIPGQAGPDSANTPFTPKEQTAISAQLKAIAESVKKTYNLTAEQSAKLDEKFEEAEKASQRMGRKDWGLLFGGAVFSLILADAITPGVAGHILMMIEHGIRHLFGDAPVGGVHSAGD